MSKAMKSIKFHAKRYTQALRASALARWQAFQRLSRAQKIALIGGTTAIVLILVPLLTYLYFVRDIYDKNRLMNRNNTGIVLTDINQEVFYSSGRASSERDTTLEQMSPNVIEALVASEDRNFYEHSGFSIRHIGGAILGNLFSRDISRYGGSTITQQLVKNNLLTNDRNFLRKYQELSMAVAIESHYSKDDILEMYLNSVYFGERSFGISQAADTYFNKTPSELSLAESAFLVGLLPAPSYYSPYSSSEERWQEQQLRVLDRMLATNKIDQSQYDQALAQSLDFAEPEIASAEAPHFTQMVIAELSERYGEERVARSGLKVTTTLNLKWQRQAEEIVQQRISIASSQGANNAALVAIDPGSGEIRALVGSVDWSEPEFGQVNMAIVPRQPGSSFKPIVYAEALDKKIITPATILKDERRVYGDYRPENFDFRFRGDVSVRHALATSLNIPAIEVIEKLGVKEASEAAKRMGISTVTEPEKYGLTLALGTAETKLLEMTNAYAALANTGNQYTPTLINVIENKFGKQERLDTNRIRRVQSTEASYLISSILKDDQARAPTFGSSLNISGREVAVKTGTTNDNVDAWAIGYSPNLAVGVWVGDNQHRPMQLGGAAAAGPIWRQSLTTMLQDLPNERFLQPGNVVSVRVCNGHGVYDEYFIRGTAPSPCNQPTNAEIEERRREEEEAERRRLEEEEAERRRLEEEEQNQNNQPPASTDPDNEDEDEDETDPSEPNPPSDPATTP